MDAHRSLGQGTRERLLGVELTPLLVVGAVAIAGSATLSAYYVHPLALPAAILGVGFIVVAVRRPAWALAVAVLAVPAEVAELPLGSGSLSPTEGMLALVGLSWLVRATLQRSAGRYVGPRDLPIAFLLAAVAIGLVIAYDPAPVVRIFLLWSLFFCVYLAIRSFTVSEIRLVIGSFLLGAGVLGALGAAEYLASGQTGVMAGGEVTEARAVGTFADANYFAALLTLGLLPGIGLILTDLRRFAPLVPAALGALAGVIFSLSRGGTLGLLGGLLLLLAWAPGRRAVAAVIAVAAVALAVGSELGEGAGPLGPVVERLSTLTAETHVVENQRPAIWRTARAIAVDNPVVGIGVNQFSYESVARHLYERGAPLENSHSLPFSLAAETGVVGLVAFVALFTQVLARGLRAVGRASPETRGLLFGLLGALVAFAVQSATVVHVRMPVVMGAFLVIAGLTTGLHDRVTATGDRRGGAGVPASRRRARPRRSSDCGRRSGRSAAGGSRG